MVRYVFIVTSGRTGSTLLASMLNTQSGVEIRGENFGFLYLQFKALGAIKLAKAHLGAEPIRQSPFFGADKVDLSEVEASITALCRTVVNANYAPETIVRGFKEVRYDMPDLEDYLRFIQRACSPSRFIFLLREADEIVDSGFWKKLPRGTASARVAAMQGRFIDFARKNSSDSFMIDYADLVDPGPVLRTLFEWLGLRYDQEPVSRQLLIPHSYDSSSVLFYTNTRLQLVSRRVLRDKFESFSFGRLSVNSVGDVVVAGTLLPYRREGSVEGVHVVPSGHAAASKARTNAAISLPSPGLRKQFPDHPYSRNARFRLEVKPVIGAADLYVTLKGHCIKIGELTLHEPGDRFIYDMNVGFSDGQDTEHLA